MKLALSLFSALCFITSFILIFCLIGYTFSGLLIFVLGAFFLYLALSVGVKKKGLIYLRRIIVLLASAGILTTICLSCVIMSDMRGDSDSPCDYLIVLGAGLDGEIPSLTLSDRLNRAHEYLLNYPNTTAIVSGGMGDGETITEALAMERYLVSLGIDKSRIIKEERATNTNENIKFSKEIIESRGGGSVAVLSSDYHIYRARRLAQSHGITATMISAKSSLPILSINYTVREGFALIKAHILHI